jgi:hypothetical protein
LYRGTNKFEKSYKLRINLVKNEIGELLADSRSNLNRWKNYFSLLLNVHRFSDYRRIEIHADEPSVPEPSPFESQIDIAKSIK